MPVSTNVLPDGSVVVTDGGSTHAPLSPEAVQAIAAVATISANAASTRQMTETLTTLATLITAAAPAAGADAYAQVTVTPGAATAVVDETSYALLRDAMPGQHDTSGGWVVGPLTITTNTPTPAPAPAPTA